MPVIIDKLASDKIEQSKVRTEARVQSALHKAKCHLTVEFAETVKLSAQEHEVRLKYLGAAASKGQWNNARKIQNSILHSPSSKLSCLVRSLNSKDDLTPAEVEAISAALDPWSDCGEKVWVTAEPKSSGFGWRPICSFGIKRRSLQTLCCDILEARHKAAANNFLTRGMGATTAVEHIARLINQGYRYFVIADVKNFFRSVQVGELHKTLGLPKQVVSNSMLIGPSASLSTYGLSNSLTVETLDGAAREGLPQGSRASQLVASILLGPILETVSSVDRSAFYGDDIAIGAQNKKQSEAQLTALEEALGLHPLGPFRLKRREIVHAYQGFDYLSYRLKTDWLTQKTWFRPSSNSYERFSRNVTRIFMSHNDGEALKHVAQYRWHFIRSFQLWKWNSLSKLMLWLNVHEAIANSHKTKSKPKSSIGDQSSTAQ